ncbi:Fur family transcriptional regulator [Sinomonas susongensis]|uniref:Fur family transcriptional regulator n=1 Tax=Sinomonas susongensis TaxID=1324851 RepID=UPI001108235F|nr:Fur family transcriptional regulator [Sinomonas susongensis]
MTRQRKAVFAALEEAGGYVSAQELHARLLVAGTPVGLSTVYRILAGLAEEGRADVLRGPDGAGRYHACRTPARTRTHHHLVCRACGRAVEIEAGEAERAVGRLAMEKGFAASGLAWDVLGTCVECDMSGETRSSAPGGLAPTASATP